MNSGGPEVTCAIVSPSVKDEPVLEAQENFSADSQRDEGVEKDKEKRLTFDVLPAADSDATAEKRFVLLVITYVHYSVCAPASKWTTCSFIMLMKYLQQEWL